MRFFLALNERGDVSFSPFQEMDKQNSGVRYLNTPLPLTAIQAVQEQMRRRTFYGFRPKGKKSDYSKARLLKVLEERNWPIQNPVWEENVPSSDCKTVQTAEMTNSQYQTLDHLIRGRQLSRRDLQVLARELKVEEEAIIRFAHANVKKGEAEWVPAVKPQGRGWQCQRCGERDVEEWPSCYGRAATCPSCKALGPSTSLGVFYRDRRPLFEDLKEVLFQPHWVLTEAQSLASAQVLEFMSATSQNKALLWAACGSGKTEVCFPAAAWALRQGRSVLFAAPRQDVIHDIAPRLKRDFPGLALQILTGSVPVRFQQGGLVLATTHQVLRFWQAFDVIFLDEMDAFPYQGSPALEWGLNHALRAHGKLLYLTATPSPKGLKEIRQGNMRLIQLPARHHRSPLPVPTIEKHSSAFDPKTNPVLDKACFEALHREGPILVFVPKISWIQPWVNQFRRYFPDWQIDGSFSSDPGRSLKLEKLRRNEFDLFVSTTILERGITLERIQVVVLAADHSVFDERALVQMAGRVGRTRENPGGNVVFMSHAESPGMKTAIRWIETQNRLARERGLIDNPS
ncbi:DEAD/DEAH box helicase family protein [Desulfosporosinus sp. PR]|uniref:DEAD/DEAH box helicase family protein n=1 Tax=Candidatus Desulfosporosinus nitrosoreducens TaxID=3401928 RepID=UPI0027EE124B|nr:DEAD/DEAH box helicase family protein [Desulfosporosinus sp. PR]MDQ7093047.1 DEAD/DEAH box helicase family protein [Desulfosporosinus sp. PR]